MKTICQRCGKEFEHPKPEDPTTKWCGECATELLDMLLSHEEKEDVGDAFYVDIE